MALKSSNVANTLLQALQKLSSTGDALVVTKETAKSVQILLNVCTVLVDSAETVAESTGDLNVREKTFQYANLLKQEAKKLDDLCKQIEANPSDPSHKPKLLAHVKNITTYTSSIVTINDSDSADHQKVIDACKECAGAAKNLFAMKTASYELFFDACKKFGGASLHLAKLLQSISSNTTDRTHQQKILSAYNNIKEVGPQMIRLAKKAFENQSNTDLHNELSLYTRQLAGKLSYCISVSQPDGGIVLNEISTSQPTVPLPKSEDPIVAVQTGGRSRRRTVNQPGQGAEILTRARTATATKEVTEAIEEASLIIKEVNVRPSSPNAQLSPRGASSATTHVSKTPQSVATNVSSVTTNAAQANLKLPSKAVTAVEEDEAESYISIIEQDLEKLEKSKENTHHREGNNNINNNNANNEWKSKYEKAMEEVTRLKERLQIVESENSMLLDENKALAQTVLDSVQKRLALRKHQ